MCSNLRSPTDFDDSQDRLLQDAQRMMDDAWFDRDAQAEFGALVALAEAAAVVNRARPG